jgi:AAA15 family ATPase/GTPase
MKYKSFYIKNYKGIKELQLELDRDPKTNIITLVGLNESGKTTILEAISLLGKESEIENIHKLIPKAQKFRFTDTIEVHGMLELDEEDEKLIAEYAGQNGLRQINKIGALTLKKVYPFKDSVFNSSQATARLEFELIGFKKQERTSKKYVESTIEFGRIKDFIIQKLLPPIIYYPNFLFNFPNRIYLEGQDSEQIIYREVLNDIVDTFQDDLNINDHIIARLRNPTEGNKESLESTITRISYQISQVVFKAWGQIFDSKGKEIQLHPALDAERNLVYLEVKLKEGMQSFQIAERSLGFKWFFTFLLFTEFRKNRASEKGETLFLLDEPASNLHSTAQKKLLTTFQNLVTNCKLIYTTHSHHLINPKWLSGAYIVQNNAINYDSEFDSLPENADIKATIYKQFVVEHPEQRTYFQPILDAIEYSPSNLEEVPNIIITEGKFDYYAFRYINEIILNNKYSGLNFYPGNSADRSSQTIGLYIAWGRDFIVLLDGDKAGDDAKKRYEKEFGVVLDGRAITLNTIDSSFNFAMEELFTVDELLKITQCFDADAAVFHKSKFNSAIQNLYIQEQAIELSDATINNFTKIFDFLSR